MNSNQSTSKLCVVCSKFYGNEESQYKCSGCFKASSASAQTIVNKPVEAVKVVTAPVEAVDTSRCSTCSRKVGLLGYACKCGKVSCAQHQLPEEHSCTFNYREEGSKKLTTQLEKVKTKKIIEIWYDFKYFLNFNIGECF